MKSAASNRSADNPSTTAKNRYVRKAAVPILEVTWTPGFQGGTRNGLYCIIASALVQNGLVGVQWKNCSHGRGYLDTRGTKTESRWSTTRSVIGTVCLPSSIPGSLATICSPVWYVPKADTEAGLAWTVMLLGPVPLCGLALAHDGVLGVNVAVQPTF